MKIKTVLAQTLLTTGELTFVLTAWSLVGIIIAWETVTRGKRERPTEVRRPATFSMGHPEPDSPTKVH